MGEKHNNVVPGSRSFLARGDLEPAGPLWQRVPTRDENGGLLSDFMMIIPHLRTMPLEQQRTIISDIERILALYEKAVVFADLNLKLNVLWVSVRPVPGICLELPAAIHMHVPEAKLIAENPECVVASK